MVVKVLVLLSMIGHVLIRKWAEEGKEGILLGEDGSEEGQVKIVVSVGFCLCMVFFFGKQS